MDETIKRILPLADYCKQNGITDVEKLRKELKPFHCIVKIRGVDYYSPSAYDEGIQEVFDQRRGTVTGKGKRHTSDYSYHKRIVTTSPKWIAGKKQAVAQAEEKLKSTTDPDARFKQKQLLDKLRNDLARMEKAFAESSEALKKMLDDNDTNGPGA